MTTKTEKVKPVFVLFCFCFCFLQRGIRMVFSVKVVSKAHGTLHRLRYYYNIAE